MAIETALARASLTRVERRNPYNLYHKMAPADLARLTPSFDWRRYLTDTGLGDVATLNVAEPKFLGEVETELKSVPLGQWKTYLRWHLVNARAPNLSREFVEEDFAFNRKTLRGVAELAPRWKRCVRWVDRDLGEALGQEFVRRTFTAETKQKTVEMTQRIETAMEREIQGTRLDDRRHQGAGAREAPCHREQGWLSGQVARLLLSFDQAGRLLRQRHARDGLRVPPGSAEDRQTRRSRRVGHDARRPSTRNTTRS